MNDLLIFDGRQKDFGNATKSGYMEAWNRMLTRGNLGARITTSAALPGLCANRWMWNRMR